MLRLHHAPRSRSSRIVWLLQELGADCEIVYTNIPRMDGSGDEDPANPHPDKKVPALVHDDAVITEHTETWHWKTGESVTLPFVSVHELRDGVIHPDRIRERIRAEGPTAPRFDRQHLDKDGHVSI